MAWRIEPKKHRVFQRNPLLAVVVDLRFHPILKVADRVADFQDRVRSTFPVFQEATNQVVSLQPFGPVAVKQEKLFQFWKVDGSATLTLTTSSLTLDWKRHADRNALIGDARIGLDALLGIYSPVSTTRLGLRYVNQIDRSRVQAELGRATTWQQLVGERFLAVPTGLAELDDETLFACEVASPVQRGALVVRYGLLREPSDGQTKFRLDLDRYLDAPFEPSEISGLLGAFSDDIFSMFVDATGPDLRTWMEAGR